VLVRVSMVDSNWSEPEGKRMERPAEERGSEGGEVCSRARRLISLGRLDLLILVVVLW
jgi:hypothetical protein